ncbi:MAG: LVIVD repeat-containing protein [Gaiellaceae bacterium]
MLGKWVSVGVAFACALALATQAAASLVPGDYAAGKLAATHARATAAQAGANGLVAKNFEVLGHHDLGLSESNGDVWVHGNFAYVGTWSDPCNGRGVKIVDVTDLANPQLIGTLAAREGTSAEDMVVRSVSTPDFTGDLMGVGIQRCGDDPALDTQQFGLELWDVTNPAAPVQLSELGLTNGGGGVHELDLFQRGGNVYALVATPFSEWFDPVPGGDFRIIDVTNPNLPVQVSEWGAGANGFSRGPFWGQGSFGASFDHSARASADGMKAYVSYWDLGVLTFDISDVTNPVLLSRTRYRPSADGDAHGMTPYEAGGRDFILQNDEDFDPTTPAKILFRGGQGIGPESAGSSPLWLEPRHRVRARVVTAANQGCDVADYPANTAGKIVVVRTLFPFFDPGFDPATSEQPLCEQQVQEAAAEAAGARAVVHDFIAEATSPQWFDFGSVAIPVLFTDHESATGMVAAGRATLQARRPSWGFLRVFDAESGRQVAKFDRAPNVHALPPPEGFWSIHNTEVDGDRAYSSWYTNGVVALNLRPLSRRNVGDPRMVGQFVPEAAPGAFPEVWGVVIRPSDRVIFVSDLGSGLWIVRATGRAAPSD